MIYPMMSVPTTQQQSKRNLDHVTFELDSHVRRAASKREALALAAAAGAPTVVVRHNLDDVHNKARMPNLPGNLLPAKNLSPPSIIAATQNENVAARKL